MKRYTEQVFTRLSKKDKRKVKTESRKFNQTPSEWIRNAIQWKLNMGE